MEQFYEQCHDLHLRLLSAIAESMHLSPAFFSSQCGQNSSELRLNFYPSANHCDLSEGNMRILSHSDFGTITLLFQDDVGGLEIESQTETGSYIHIASGGKTELVLNVGDCLQRWTNGEILHPYVDMVHVKSISKHFLTNMPGLDRLRSANHRVTLPVDLKASAESRVDERYSVAYFGKPDRHALVRSLPEVAQGQPLRYTETMTAWEFNQARLLQTY
jgi:isopenicillin N synthase-like dioxygenase